MKNKKKKKKKGNILVVSVGLKGFVDWVDPTVSDPVEKREDNMSSLSSDLSFSTRLANVGPHRLRMPNRLVLSWYVLRREWDRPSANTVAPDPKTAQEIIDHWSPFNKRESSVTCMRDLYPILL